jgi:hypothetical protein
MTITAMNAEIDCNSDSEIISINEVEINQVVFQDDLVNWELLDREDFIDKLIVWTAEAMNNPEKSSDAMLMKQDLVMLIGLDDEYVWSSTTTNEYVSPSKEAIKFNEICQQVLEVNSSI